MARPTSFTPLINCINSCLTNNMGTLSGSFSSSRLIPTGEFIVSAPEEDDGNTEDARARAVLVNKTISFSINSLNFSATARLPETHSFNFYDIELGINVQYNTGDTLIDTTWTNLWVEIANDIHLIRKTVSEPNKLVLDPVTLTDTGLLDGMLFFVNSGTPQIDSSKTFATCTSTWRGVLCLGYV